MRLKKCIPPLLHGNATFQKEIVTDRSKNKPTDGHEGLLGCYTSNKPVCDGLLMLDTICRSFLTTDEHEHLKESLRSKKHMPYTLRDDHP